MTRTLGRTGLSVSPIGFGAFKIGRNQGVKYPTPYELPDEKEVSRLLNAVLDLGCTLIDTAPAYGLSEARIGDAIGHRRGEIILSTKVGETFADGVSTYDFSEGGIRTSLERSLRKLRTDFLDVVLIHSSGDDLQILRETPAVEVLQQFKDRGVIGAIGMSGKTVEGASQALNWADVLMVEFNLNDTTHAEVIQAASDRDVAIFVKKGLASGKLAAEDSIRFVLGQSGVTSLILGGLNLDHFRENWRVALESRRP
ncbi:aldo/keto reductase [Schlesneria sp.]|uniref:aldo/keto reductase n=1 Tax=Schlesneria sp. TaxID=2762018 RepID=UPI002F0FAF32